jgi:hypothetical protein
MGAVCGAMGRVVATIGRCSVRSRRLAPERISQGDPRRGHSLSPQLPGALVETPIRLCVLQEDELSFHGAMVA